MKTFKQLISEIAQPKSPEERAFKDQHVVQKFDYPVKDSDAIFKGTVEKKKRPADYDATSDKAAYDKATPEKPPFKMPRNVDESVEQIDEISADLAKRALDKRSDQYNRLSKGAERADALKNRSIAKAAKRRNREMGTNDAKEREIAKHIDTAKKADTKAANLRSRAKTPDKKADKTYDYMKKRGMKTESAEQIDEISKDLAGRYIKKAQISTADAGRDTMDDRPHIRKRGINKIVNRRTGTADAIRKLTGKARVPATESIEENKKSDLMKKLAKASAPSEKGKASVTLKKAPWDKNEELSDKQKKIDMNKNGKIDGHDLAMLRAKKKKNEEVELDEVKRGRSTMDRLKDMQDKSNAMAYKGYKKKPAKKMKKEEVELDEAKKLSPGMKDLIKHGNKKADATAKEVPGSLDRVAKRMAKLKNMRKADKSWGKSKAFDYHEEVELDEVTQSATKKMVNVTGPDGKVHTVMKKTKTTQYDDKGQEKIKTNESFDLTEGVKVGNMKLRDGSSVKISSQDAKLINQMMKDLNAANRRKMEKVMMMDKAGFEEILGFAREAM